MGSNRHTRDIRDANVYHRTDDRWRWVSLIGAVIVLVAILAVATSLIRERYAPSAGRPASGATGAGPTAQSEQVTIPPAALTSAPGASGTIAAIPDAPSTEQPRVAATAPSTPVAVGTQISIQKVGLSVQLPGSGWVSTTPGDYPDTRSERWYNHDRSLVFAVFVFDDHMREGHAGLKAFAEEFAYDFQMAPVGEAKDQRFQGQRAWRIEGTGLGQQETFGPEYRFVEYWLEKEDGIYLILAGSKADQWQSGGAQKVEAILGSVRLDR